MLRVLCAALGAAFLAAAMTAAPADAAEREDLDAAAFNLLRGGGNVLVMRHANSPHDQLAPVGMTESCTLQPGRGLDAKGLFQARALGEFIRTKGIPILKAYTSDMCRAWDTARLVAGGAPVIPHAVQKTTDPASIAAFKKQIEAELAANPGQNIILSSHSNIAPLYGAAPAADEAEIPSGTIFVVRPPAWESAIRIDLVVGVAPQTVTVE